MFEWLSYLNFYISDLRDHISTHTHFTNIIHSVQHIVHRLFHLNHTPHILLTLTPLHSSRVATLVRNCANSPFSGQSPKSDPEMVRIHSKSAHFHDFNWWKEWLKENLKGIWLNAHSPAKLCFQRCFYFNVVCNYHVFSLLSPRSWN